METSDFVVCVQEYPESGDQAVVFFVNLTTLEADGNKDCQQYAKEVRLALKDEQRSGTAKDFVCDGCLDSVEKHEVNLSCMVHDCVTFYE